MFELIAATTTSSFASTRADALAISCSDAPLTRVGFFQRNNFVSDEDQRQAAVKIDHAAGRQFFLQSACQEQDEQYQENEPAETPPYSRAT